MNDEDDTRAPSVQDVFGGRSMSEYSGSEYGGHGPPSQSTVRPLNQSSINQARQVQEERTVKRLRLRKALTLPESTTIFDACRRMAARRVKAALLTDSNKLLCGILTDRDITTRVVARELDVENTPVAKVMTRNPVFITMDTLAVEALQKMVQGKFRHLPVVENGDVVAILHIASCLYDAISHMERASQKKKASDYSSFIETQQLFKPLSTIISENSKLVTVSLSDTVLIAVKAMLECGINSAIVTVDSKPQGILTSMDILMRVIAQGLPPDLTLVEKVMTPNPQCVTNDTSIVDALHIMHEGKFLNLPVVDKDGNVVVITDVLHIAHAAVASVGTTAGTDNNAASSMMQKFWDSAMAPPPADDNIEPERAPSIQNAFGRRNMSVYSASEYGGRGPPSQSAVRPLDQGSAYVGSEYEYQSRIAPSLGAVQAHYQKSIYEGSNSEYWGQGPPSIDGVRPSSYSNVNQAPYQKSAERTVKQLRLTKALTVPDATTISEACRRMAARKVDALLLTDSNALLCGILTDRDITTRVVACELDIESTPVSAVMTKNPVFVISNTLAVEALQKMALGKFRHLPVVENGEVVAILDIAKCLYDATACMEIAAEKGIAIAAAVEGVEKHRGSSGSNTFIETIKERLFKPSLSTIISDNLKLVTVSPSDTVLIAAKAMLECRNNSAIITVDNKPQGIITSEDIVMRVLAKGLAPDSTLVEKVMTPNPKCATIDTPILDALHTMHDGKFLYLPIVDGDGNAVATTDVHHITHATIASVSETGWVIDVFVNII